MHLKRKKQGDFAKWPFRQLDVFHKLSAVDFVNGRVTAEAFSDADSKTKTNKKEFLLLSNQNDIEFHIFADRKLILIYHFNGHFWTFYEIRS